ncbi:M48 family metallopeptidase [Asaia sp. HN010]|uniref:M48 family metallopeptidase n=1 Tax=Asaia sp. HN010 TaxID=3081233 RepID=UPI00301765E5
MPPHVSACIYPKEKRYGAALTIIGCAFWLVIILSILVQKNVIAALILVAIYGVLLWVLMKFFAALFRAWMLGNMVALSERQFPELYAIFAEVSQNLGLKAAPEAFVYNSHGAMNALALRLSRGRYVLLTSALVETEDNAQLRFVIGHEIAHHVLGHLNPLKQLIRYPAVIVPFLYPAYSRAREYSCDAVGASLLENKNEAFTALQMLACGAKRLNHKMNPIAFVAQEQRMPGFAGFCREICLSHPRLTLRVKRLMTIYPVNTTMPKPLSTNTQGEA